MQLSHRMAQSYLNQGRYAEAESLFQHALAIYEQALGPDSPRIIDVLEDYAIMLRSMQRTAEAARLEARIAAIRAKRGVMTGSDEQSETEL